MTWFRYKLRQLRFWIVRLFTPAKGRLRLVATRYFEEHPDAKDGVMKAYYAYHAPHFRLEPKGHNFTNSSRESKCAWCDRSREMVRHDDLPPECGHRPELLPIEDVILKEEQKALLLRDMAKSVVPKIVAKMGMSGKTLAVLHHTYGHDPETVASVMEVPDQAMEDYHLEMAAWKVR